MATQTVVQQQPAAETVDIWITDLIEADYATRGVFPEIRKELANSECGAKRRYSVTRAEAQAIYEDAEEMRRQRRQGKAGKGLSIAYCATANRLYECRAKPETPPQPNPNPAELLRLCQEMREAERQGCALAVGTQILYFRTNEEDGQRGVITKPFYFHKVDDKDGDFVDTDGSRFAYRPGYCIQLDAGQTWFVPAHTLSLDDCKPTHLRLACVAGQHLPAS